MSSTTHPADLDGCIRPLAEDDRLAVVAYWEHVIGEELALARPVPRAVPLPEDGRRERRSTRRAVARIAAVSRVRVVGEVAA